LWTQQSFVYEMLRHRETRSWLSMVSVDLTSALIWALITPVVLAAAKRYPVNRAQGVRRGIGYVVAGMVTTLTHAALLQQLTARDTPLWSPPWQTTLAVGFVIFLILAAIGH